MLSRRSLPSIERYEGYLKDWPVLFLQEDEADQNLAIVMDSMSRLQQIFANQNQLHDCLKKSQPEYCYLAQLAWKSESMG